MVFPPGKTVNSYRHNHDIMGMLPIPPKAVERGLAPPDLFPHKSSAKTLWSSAMGYHTRSRLHTPQTSKIATMNSMPACFCGHALRDERQGETGIRITKGVHMQRIGVVVVAASALHRRYDHHFQLGSSATIRQFA
jgi:hypothetical protein